MVKAFRALMLGLLLLVTLAACGGGGGTTSPSTGAGGTTSSAAGGASASSATESMEASASSAASSTMASASASTGAGGATGTATADETATATGDTAAALAPAQPDTSLTATLTGSGASFPNQIYGRWIEDYKGVVPGVTINYNSVGSGQGIRDFTDGVTQFGASDAFLNEDQLKAVPDALHIPMVAGAVVATYNLEGVTNLKFSPETLAKIFLGEITNWNDPAIAADNTGATLPSQAITVVYRSDGSGTTSIFTNYLSSVSADWKSRVGAGTTVQWPVGQGAEKNDGVASTVRSTVGAIGYVELIYALGNNLPAPAIKNAAGNFVEPSLESVTEAANGFTANLPEDLRVNIVNPPTGANAYPISGFTWILVHQSTYTDANQAKALADFLYWCLASGDDAARELRYAPLPNSVKQRAVDKLEQIQVNGQQVFTAPGQ